MSSITDLIKELRDKTGAGFLDCKKSLEENSNDIEKSIEALRKKGLAKKYLSRSLKIEEDKEIKSEQNLIIREINSLSNS